MREAAYARGSGHPGALRILELHALRGRNRYAPHPLVRMLLDLGDLPPGIAHDVAHRALALQGIAGGAAEVRPTRNAREVVVLYSYADEEAALRAGSEAVDIEESLHAGRAVDVAGSAARVQAIATRNAYGPSEAALVAEARRRKIPVLDLRGAGYLQLGHGARQRRLQATLTDRTGGIGMDIADDKERTKRILQDAGFPVPVGESVASVEDALELAARLGYPVVVKPLIGNHGRGITTGIRGPDELRHAWPAARAVHARVVVERHVPGHDFRLLVVDHKLVAAARRDPAHVVGDGHLTVTQLVQALNADPRRGEGHERVLTRIRLDADLQLMLERQGLALHSVPAAGRVVLLRGTANLSSGGTAADVTDEVHDDVRTMAEAVSRIVGLDVTGIDVVAPTLAAPLAKTGGAIVEVNAAPGLRMHLAPTHGRPRDVAAPIVELLFPRGETGRIPIVAITGTNGKTTTARLLAHILRTAGAHVGLTGTTGVEIDGVTRLRGDYSGPSGAGAVLREPTVDHAVLEVARGGLLRRGLGIDACDVGVLLNVGNDHLGEGEIETIEDLARLKGIVPESATRAAVLNAEDARVVAMRDRLRAPVVLFALDPEAPALRAHVATGGVAVTLRDETIVLVRDGQERAVVDAREVPITLQGAARFNVQNALAATAACDALGLDAERIAAGLRSFVPSAEQLPGRLNVFDIDGVRVLVDYGHNVPAVEALGQMLPRLGSGRRINVANASGNRRDEDIVAFGAALARLYDEVLLSDPDPRARTPGETTRLLARGLREAGFDERKVHTAADEPAAIARAFEMARPGDVIVIQADDVGGAIAAVRARIAAQSVST